MLRFLFRLVAALPLWLVHALGAGLGSLVYWASASYRRTLRENLEQAGYEPARLAAPARRAAGRQALETPWIWMRPTPDIVSRTTVVDMDVFEAAMADGRSVLFLPPHLGCFEIMAQWYGATQASRYGRPMTVLYRVPRKPVLRQIVAQGREREGLVLAPADVSGVRKLMRAMKNREILGILPDQVPSQGEGVWAPFFGRLAYTMTLPTRLAHQFDGLIVFVWGQRLAGGAGWRLHARRLDEPLTGDPLEDATRMNRGLERLVRDKPEQYLWGYKRYKVPSGVEPPGPQP